MFKKAEAGTSPDELYRRYGSIVYRRARRLLGDDQEATTTSFEVFRQLSRELPAFQRASPVTWLYRASTQRCLELLRRQDRGAAARRTSGEILRVVMSRETSEESAPCGPLRSFGDVPEELRVVAIYSFVDQMSRDEIAQVLGLPQRSVSALLDSLDALPGRARRPRPRPDCLSSFALDRLRTGELDGWSEGALMAAHRRRCQACHRRMRSMNAVVAPPFVATAGGPTNSFTRRHCRRGALWLIPIVAAAALFRLVPWREAHGRSHGPEGHQGREPHPQPGLVRLEAR